MGTGDYFDGHIDAVGNVDNEKKVYDAVNAKFPPVIVLPQGGMPSNPLPGTSTGSVSPRTGMAYWRAAGEGARDVFPAVRARPPPGR